MENNNNTNEQLPKEETKVDNTVNNKVDIKGNDKAKKEKKPKEPMDRKDMLCYIGAVCFLILALLPMLLRNFDLNYNPDGTTEEESQTEQPKVVINNLKCSKTFEEEGFSYYVEVSSTYANDEVQQTNITYDVTLDPAYSLKFEDVIIPEYDTLSKIESNGIGTSVDAQKYIVNISYTIDSSLRDNAALKNHSNPLNMQRELYTNELNNYVCTVQDGGN